MILAKSTIGESSLRSNKRAWYPNNISWFRNFIRHAPNNTKLHVEVFVEGGEATDVIHYLIHNLADLSMRVTGIETWRGIDMCLADLRTVDALCGPCGLEAARWAKWLPSVNYEDLAIMRGIEGFVLKSHSYVPNRMYKVKPVFTADLIIDGFVDGRGKYLGLIGAIVCIDGSGKTVCKVSGMTDAVRIGLEHSDIGRVIEVAYQKVTKGEKLRHPRFKRFRDDKTQMQVDTICW